MSTSILLGLPASHVTLPQSPTAPSRRPIDSQSFFAEVAERFPGIARNDAFESPTALPHRVAASLAELTQAAIDSDDEDMLREYFGFLDRVLENSTAEVVYAIKVSYLGNLRFEGRYSRRSNARELLPPSMAKKLAELENYLAALLDELHCLQK